MILQPLVAGRVRGCRGGESFAAQAARVTAAAGASRGIGLIAGHRLRVVDTEPQTGADDLRLGPGDERCVYATGITLDTGLGRERRERREGGDELRPAIRVAARIEHVDADEQVA